MPRIEESVLDEALKLHAAGWWVVPQWGRAAPLGWPDHRVGEDDLRSYLSNGSANLALVLNQSDVMDVECDNSEGEALIRSLCLPGELQTPTWRSRRGLHRLFKRPTGLPDKSKVEAAGIEFRIGNRGALSTVPPSVHPEGNVYEWLDGLSIWDITPAPLPEALRQLILRSPDARRIGKAGETMEVDDIPEGRRNDELFLYGSRLLRDNYKPDDLRNAVIGRNARLSNPLPDSEIGGIVASIERIRDGQRSSSKTERCESWEELIDWWREAMEWRQSMGDVLAVMLAVALSTDQVGESQLCLHVLGDAGSGKTRFCEGMLRSDTCDELGIITGFFSGWKNEEGKDYSKISRCNHKTLIGPEGDVLTALPQFQELMSQQRRMFDGTMVTTYKNQDTDNRYDGLRMPMILAGTPAMLNHDHSRVGDRFLRVYVDQPVEDQREAILRRVVLGELDNVTQKVNCSPQSIVSPKMDKAYRATGGYVDWLRRNAEELLARCKVSVDERLALARMMSVLGEVVAKLRARPDPGKWGEEKHETVELPTRLAAQFTRLASCLAVVLNRWTIDDEVLRIVRKVALDTARGRTMNVVRFLVRSPHGSEEADTLAIWCNEDKEKFGRLIRFMRRIGVVEQFDPPKVGGLAVGRRQRLTRKFRALWDEATAETKDPGG